MRASSRTRMKLFLDCTGRGHGDVAADNFGETHGNLEAMNEDTHENYTDSPFWIENVTELVVLDGNCGFGSSGVVQKCRHCPSGILVARKVPRLQFIIDHSLPSDSNY